eukprot:TRINITY_DN10741_c0_g1_i1.p1 TRINITY_DN10741_c0_g1~~TRINITY_DN10741_c0_g1_i1.p1  ORF type:complete len:229 (-),score=12.48 TRINITY_DN10741_c0_g1_i1:856-1542(-)
MDEQMAALQEREDSTRRKLAMLKQQLQQEKQLQPKQGHPQPISSAQTCSRSGTERSVSKTHRVSNVAPAAERPRSRIQKEIPVTTVQHHKTVAGSSSIASGTSSSANHSQPSSQPQVVHIASRPVAKTSPVPSSSSTLFLGVFADLAPGAIVFLSATQRSVFVRRERKSLKPYSIFLCFVCLELHAGLILQKLAVVIVINGVSCTNRLSIKLECFEALHKLLETHGIP